MAAKAPGICSVGVKPKMGIGGLHEATNLEDAYLSVRLCSRNSAAVCEGVSPFPWIDKSGYNHRIYKAGGKK
jgi:hypothetical protein